MIKTISFVLLIFALSLITCTYSKNTPQKNCPLPPTCSRRLRQIKPHLNILTKIKNYTVKAIYKTKLLTYVNDINNLNLRNEKNEFYLIALPLSDKFNPFVGTFCHNNIQYSDKASLPVFIYDILLNKHIEVPWNFVIEKVDIKKTPFYKNVCMSDTKAFSTYQNINKLDRVFINVLDFKAKKNFIFLPTWVMQSLQLDCFDVVRLRFTKLETASSVVLQPHHKKFFNLSEPKVGQNELKWGELAKGLPHHKESCHSPVPYSYKTLEEKLRYYSCLTKNSTICINHDGSDYYFDVIKMDAGKKKDVEVASIQDADVIFDFVKEKYDK